MNDLWKAPRRRFALQIENVNIVPQSKCSALPCSSKSTFWLKTKMSKMHFPKMTFTCGQHCWTMSINLTWMRSCRTCGWYCRCCPCPASSGVPESWSPPVLADGTSSRSSPSWGQRAGGSCGRTPWAPGQTSPCLSPSGSRTWGEKWFHTFSHISYNIVIYEKNGEE